jgi:flagellar biosynthesis protein FlhG
MYDQAAELRQLVVRSRVKLLSAPLDGAPWLIAVAGSKGGVGTTTVAVNLAVAMAQAGQRVVLVEASADRADAATLCRLEPHDTLADVLQGKRSIHEVLMAGPAGIQVLPGPWGCGNPLELAPDAPQRLLNEFHTLGPYADAIVFDVGCRCDAATRRFWQVADSVLLVTTPDPVAVMDAYAAIKSMLAQSEAAPPVYSLVNHAPSTEQAREVHNRLETACRRFLKRELSLGGHLAEDPHVAQSGRQRSVAVQDDPQGETAALFGQLAQRLAHKDDAVVRSSSTTNTGGQYPARPLAA